MKTSSGLFRDMAVYVIDLLREICILPVLKLDFTAHGKMNGVPLRNLDSV
jgi:hypothetical protein